MDRMITVTEGHGADFKKTEMLESEFNAKFRKHAEPEAVFQTEYDESVLAGNDEPETAKETKKRK